VLTDTNYTLLTHLSLRTRESSLQEPTLRKAAGCNFATLIVSN